MKMVDDKTKTYAFLGIMVLIHVAYVIVFFGIFYINPAYIAELSSFVQIAVSIFLIWRFNPFREWMSLKEPRLTNFDRMIIYSSATFLLVNVALTATITSFFIKTVESRIPKVIQGHFNGHTSTSESTTANTVPQNTK